MTNQIYNGGAFNTNAYRYQITNSVAFDFIYGYVFAKSGDINDVNPATGVTGHFNKGATQNRA